MTAIVSFGAACLQRISGFGFALLATPILAIVMPVPLAVVVITLVSFPNGILNWIQQRAHADRPQITRIVVGCVAGMPLGLIINKRLPDRPMRILLGVVVAAGAAALAAGWRVKGRGKHVDVVSGFISGMLATSTGTNGPPLVVGLQGQGVTPERFRATLAGSFIWTGAVTIVLFWLSNLISEQSVHLAAVGIVPMLAGQVAGRGLVGRVQQAHFRKLVITLLFLTAATAIVNALR